MGDSLQYHAALPSPELPPVSMAFSTTVPSSLTLALPNNTLVFFDVESRTVPTWGERIVERGIFDAEREHNPIIGMCYDPVPAHDSLDVLIIYGATWMITVPVPKAEPAQGRQQESGSSSARGNRPPCLPPRHTDPSRSSWSTLQAQDTWSSPKGRISICSDRWHRASRRRSTGRTRSVRCSRGPAESAFARVMFFC